MEQVTKEQIGDAIKEHKIQRFLLRRCSVCEAPLYYQFRADETVWFDSNCDCTINEVAPQQQSLDTIATLLNRQSPKLREGLWKKFIESGTA